MASSALFLYVVVLKYLMTWHNNLCCEGSLQELVGVGLMLYAVVGYFFAIGLCHFITRE